MMGKYLNLYYESVMTPTPTPYAPANEYSSAPTSILVLFDEDKKPLLSSRGVVISAFSSQGNLDNYANSLYGLIRNAKEIYSVIPELYSQAITKLDEKELYKYIKDNGVLHARLEDAKAEDRVYIDALDTDPDFELDGTVVNEKLVESLQNSDYYVKTVDGYKYSFKTVTEGSEIIMYVEEIHPYDLAEYHWLRSSSKNPDVIEVRSGGKLVELVDAFNDEEEPLDYIESAKLLRSYNKDIKPIIDRT